MMTKAASYLEMKGGYVDREESKECSNMSVFGMRSTRGHTGWYKHKDINVYKVATELLTFVSEKIEVKYPSVFKHLRKILHEEGFEDGLPTMKNLVFTTFSVTKDFSCRPHTDADDYDLGFILWLQEGDIEEDEEVSLFTFPEFEVGFSPKHGDVLCSRANSFAHCTRNLKKKNQLGLAFVQKASLLRQLKKLLDLSDSGVLEHHIPKKGKRPKRTILERKLDFFAKKETYELELALGKFSLTNFQDSV